MRPGGWAYSPTYRELLLRATCRRMSGPGWNLRMRLCSEAGEDMTRIMIQVVLQHFAFVVQYLRNSEVWRRFELSSFFKSIMINFLCGEVQVNSPRQSRGRLRHRDYLLFSLILVLGGGHLESSNRYHRRQKSLAAQKPGDGPYIGPLRARVGGSSLRARICALPTGSGAPIFFLPSVLFIYRYRLEANKTS